MTGSTASTSISFKKCLFLLTILWPTLIRYSLVFWPNETTKPVVSHFFVIACCIRTGVFGFNRCNSLLGPFLSVSGSLLCLLLKILSSVLYLNSGRSCSFGIGIESLTFLPKMSSLGLSPEGCLGVFRKTWSPARQLFLSNLPFVARFALMSFFICLTAASA